MADHEGAAPETAGQRSAALPVVLIAVALLGLLGYQTFQLLRDAENLAATRTNQETAIADARRIRTQLNGIAQGTTALAQAGNVNARQVIADLRRRGIRVGVRRKPAAD